MKSLLKIVSFACLFPVLAMAQSALPNTSVVVVDDHSPGLTFQGIGAASAGASSRLLIDYPEPQRSQILDYLFKPNYGAGFHHLKVEVGSDMNSTDGTEPSHMRTKDEENDNRGYEWWLMEQAKQRNPSVILDCLAWGAPGWVGGGKFYSQDMADYYTRFLLAAKKAHGLDISYVGVWNERKFDPEWIKLFRKTLDAAGLQHAGIVGADFFHWAIIPAVINDPELAKSIAVIGDHYPHNASPPEAKTCGKALWSSEDGPWQGNWGGACNLAKLYNRNYIVGKMVSTEIWSPITSYYDIFPLPSSGNMRANAPWSGAYTVQPAIWATAHTTQFAQPGWVYMDSACTLLDGIGSVVALHSPSDSDFSMVLETMTANKAHTISFQLKGPWAGKPIQVWRTTSKENFVLQPDLPVTDNTLTLTVDPSAIYSITTLTTPHKGDAVSPAETPLPLPYKEDFESYNEGATPKYWSDYGGAFEVVKRSDGQGKALRQVIPKKGIEWQGNPFPETFMGETLWKDTDLSTDVMVEGDGFASLFGRVSGCAQNGSPPRGVWFKVETDGKWTLSQRIKQGKVDVDTIIGQGTAPFPSNQWQKLRLLFKGDQVTASINGTDVTSAHTDCGSGLAGIGCGWHAAQFDNILIR